jgi:hypothetical protein
MFLVETEGFPFIGEVRGRKIVYSQDGKDFCEKGG